MSISLTVTQLGGLITMKAPWLVIGLTAGIFACLASSAVAHEFISSPEKRGFVGKGGAQTITLGKSTVNCESATITGHAVPELLSLEVGYEGCEAFSAPVEVSEAAYDLTANGSGGIAAGAKATVTINFGEEAECVYTLPESSKAVSSVSYSNTETGIAVNSALKGLAYELKQKGTSACGTNGEKGSGEYKGEVTTETFEGVKCVWWGLGGFYYFTQCGFDGGGLWELVFGYSSLKWS
jgi:hypothetical protein